MKKYGVRMLYLNFFAILALVLAACAPALTGEATTSGVPGARPQMAEEEIAPEAIGGLMGDEILLEEAAPIVSMTPEELEAYGRALFDLDVPAAEEAALSLTDEDLDRLTDALFGGVGGLIEEEVTPSALGDMLEELDRQTEAIFGGPEGLMEEEVASSAPVTTLPEEVLDEFSLGGMEGVMEEVAPAVTRPEELLDEFGISLGPAILFFKPDIGGLVQDSLVIDVNVWGITLDPEAIGKANVEGRGHWHAYIDGKLLGFSGATSLALNKDVLAEFGPGVHELKIELHNNDHSLVAGAGSDIRKVSFDFGGMEDISSSYIPTYSYGY